MRVTPTLPELFPAPGAAEPRVLVRALAAFGGPGRYESHGAVTEPSFLRMRGGTPLRGSPLAQEIFGPIIDDRCACGRLDGPSHRGALCERCGVASLPRKSRAERWAHIDIPGGFIHPALAPIIAGLIGCSAADVLAIARYEAWWTCGVVHRPPGDLPPQPHALGVAFWDRKPEGFNELDPAEQQLTQVNVALRRLGALPEWAQADYGSEEGWYNVAIRSAGAVAVERALAELDPAVRERFAAEHGVPTTALVLRRFPVPPPDLRPLEPRAGGLPQPGPDNLALGRLVEKARLSRRLEELEVRTVTTLAAQREVQIAAEHAALRFAGAPPPWAEPRVIDALPKLHGAPATDAAYPAPERRAELGDIRGLAFIGEDTLLLGFPYATVRIDLSSGRVRGAWRSAGLRLLGVDEGDRRALYIAHDTLRLAVVDLASMEWLDATPADLGAVFAVNASEAELEMVSTKDRRAHPLGEGPSQPVALSPCGQFVWYSRVHRISGEIEAEPWWDGCSFDAPLALRDDGTFGAPDEEADDSDWEQSTARALVLLSPPRSEWWFVDGNRVFRGLEPSIRLELLPRAAAFSRDGRLALATDSWVALLELGDEPRIITRWSIRRLKRRLAVPPRGARVSVAAMHAALSFHGTLERVADASVEALASLSIAESFKDPVPMGEREARCVLDIARATKTPLRLQRPRKPR